MSLETSRLRIASVTGGPLRITGASLVTGAYEFATVGDADYELLTERQTTMDNILFIPGIANPVSEINSLLFGAGQQGTFIAPSLTPSLISGSTFGTGVQTLPDLSPRNNPFSQATPANRAAWFREPKRGRVNLFVNTHFTGAVAGSPGTAPTSWANSFTTGEIVSYDAATGKLRLRTSGTRRVFNQAANMPTNSVQISRLRVNVISGTISVNRVLGINVALAPGASVQYQINGVNAAGTDNLPLGESLITYRQTTTTDAWTLNLLIGNGTGDVTTADVEIWEPQLETGSTATAYQRVTTAFDVTEAGQRDCYGVRTDGTDDWYQTAGNVDFSGTDKVTVFAALRKRSDAATGCVVELSATNAINNGTFALFAPSTNGANSYRWQSKFDVPAVNAGTGVFAAAPDICVLTAVGDINAPLAQLFRDNVSIEATTTSQGTGNYGSYQLFVGARGGGSLFLNADIFGLIVAGGGYSLSTRQRIARLLSRITPTVNL